MMDHKIAIQAQSTTRDAAGQVIGGWADVASVWSDMRFQSGAEVVRAGLPVSTVRISAMIYARNDLNTAMRVAHKGATYDIKAILPARDPRFMYLVCESAK